MSFLRSVPPDGLPPEAIDREAAHAALDRILTKNPSAITILAEAPDTYDWASIPNSQSLARGLVEDCLEIMMACRVSVDD